ncbi:OSBP(oxysterol binding protein)-related protein 1C isoform 1 [Dorcoceras hygrometricum]|uniref:OSBP(Oxysterol binding protein)-related protein 1C isoform 1 n=1 Tax=Dorcoceras hygrometricum TaxID=472368 RepID=A0A2Z7CTC2_9LAMI|nr:OSBP(oxysterol binding protein)-related protein 1C isoform 1 [Dorcoceras hygrometricum]
MRPFCCVPSTPIGNPNMPTFTSTPPPFDPHTKSQQNPAIRAISRVSATCDSGIDHNSGGAPSGNNILHAHAQSRDTIINDIVDNGISGVLYKWVNYGKGWRPRWFVLQDGVLSYYKIQGPDKIVVNQVTEKGLKVEVNYYFRIKHVII